MVQAKFISEEDRGTSNRWNQFTDKGTLDFSNGLRFDGSENSVHIKQVESVSAVRMKQPRNAWITVAALLLLALGDLMLIGVMDGRPIDKWFFMVIGINSFAICFLMAFLKFFMEMNWRVIQIEGTTEAGEAGTWNFMGVGVNPAEFLLKFRNL